MLWLIHPSHRKFIKLLHEKVRANRSIVITKDNFIAKDHLWSSTTNSMKRHQGVYKIIIKATNNRIENIAKEQIWRQFKVDDIEAILRKVELKSPYRTIKNTIYYYPILKYLPLDIAKQNKIK